MADRLIRETQPNAGEFPSPVPQYWNQAAGRYEKVSDTQPLPTRGAGVATIQTNAVTVTTGQVELKASTSAMAGRKQLLVYAPTAGTVYWGPTGVTAAAGAPLTTGDAPLSFDLDPTTPLAIYAVSDGTDRSVRVVEAK